MPNSVQPPTPSDSELADYDPDTCDAPDCENSLDDGEGYDGYCGAHADQRETSGAQSA
ncbi:hypothetical protein [Rhodococcus qingshengii]|uniref:hypothetical protein n=1 Tax=Rhodococcus qingshengii TaxID=334542 RepID=UPI00287F5095|nr:hypothetical protein [Rhodococcus qingshengii]